MFYFFVNIDQLACTYDVINNRKSIKLHLSIYNRALVTLKRTSAIYKMFHYLHSSIPRANRSETYSTNILSNVSYGGTRETLYTELKIFPFSSTGSVSEIYGLSCITGHHDDHIIIISSGKNHKKKNTTVQDGRSVRARARLNMFTTYPRG